MKTKTRKRPLAFCKTYSFASDKTWDAATPLRAMAQFTKRHEDVTVISVGVFYDDEGYVSVVLTIEDTTVDFNSRIDAALADA